MTGVLAGLKVVEMGPLVAGPLAAGILADWGADVIKVEPLTGEDTRGLTTGQKVTGQLNVSLEHWSRNRKGLAVDLKKEAGRDILCQLIKKSDVFISNHTVVALNRLKLDYDSLSQVNPRLIYAIITGYGTVGPDKDEPGYDLTAAWARAGFQYTFSQPGMSPPMGRSPTFDTVTAGNIVMGVLGALLHREKTGQGQEVEVSLYHSGIWILSSDIQAALMGQPRPPHDRTKAANPIWNPYRTKDGHWLQLGMLRSLVHWPNFCRAIDRPELEKDPRFDSIETRTQNCEELVRIIDEILASKTRQEWEKIFRENHCVYGRVETPLEVTSNPQALAIGAFAEIDHPLVGKMKIVTTPVHFRQNPASVGTPAPELGQHNEEILLELGYSWEDIARLKDEGVIL